jgi:hypothetical protein
MSICSLALLKTGRPVERRLWNRLLLFRTGRGDEASARADVTARAVLHDDSHSMKLAVERFGRESEKVAVAQFLGYRDGG